MEAEYIIEVVEKLIGPTYPVGASHRDGEALMNLKKQVKVICELMVRIHDISELDNGIEKRASVLAAAKVANDCLDQMGIAREDSQRVVDEKKLQSLKMRAAKFDALEACGIDTWSMYNYAMNRVKS